MSSTWPNRIGDRTDVIESNGEPLYGSSLCWFIANEVATEQVDLLIKAIDTEHPVSFGALPIDATVKATRS
jgi:hypothetical protein